ncbi:MAG: phenylalanine aminomutase (D-beta-phenylalanine forming) [Verrucomicrobia bacterium]|nr:phenylalanine aminomutase (D-beta-phenylalanine forming) [Verrucomicrobiota bacterium]
MRLDLLKKKPLLRKRTLSSTQLTLDGNSLSTFDVISASYNVEQEVTVSKDCIKRLKDSHLLLNQMVNSNRVIYGVNTSVGGFVNCLVATKHAQKLQENLISAVATNVGPYLDDTVVRAAMLVRLNSLARGCSGISYENFNKLLKIYNAGIIPCIPSKGSLGASGDLGPLACIALVAIGKWKATYKGKILSGDKALELAGIKPMKLGFKEGLSLVNGTSAMTGFAAILIEEVISLIKTYDVISCLTFEGLKVKKKPFNPIVHLQKPHQGQLQTAENIWSLLEDSKMIVDERDVEKQLQDHKNETITFTDSPIEDAYSIRCTPHIVGPIRDTIQWIQSTIANEINSSNDNPLIIPDCQEVFHNGHFHGQYISMAMDYLSICLTTLSNLSDRRIDRFMDKHHSNGLPPFLCNKNAGLRLGLMGGQFMSTSLTAENRSLCNPVSIQSLTSTGDFQDHVSMGLVAARRAREIYENTSYVLAFELLCAAQAAEIRNAELLSTPTKHMFTIVRESVPFVSEDRCLTDDLEKISTLIKSGYLLKEIENSLGKKIIFSKTEKRI